MLQLYLLIIRGSIGDLCQTPTGEMPSVGVLSWGLCPHQIGVWPYGDSRFIKGLCRNPPAKYRGAPRESERAVTGCHAKSPTDLCGAGYCTFRFPCRPPVPRVGARNKSVGARRRSVATRRLILARGWLARLVSRRGGG